MREWYETPSGSRALLTNRIVDLILSINTYHHINMMSMRNIGEGYQVTDLNALASVQCRPFRFFLNDKVQIPSNPDLMVRRATLDGRDFDQFFISATINGNIRIVPLNALIRTPLPGSDTEGMLMKASRINEQIVRTTNAKEALECLLGKSLTITAFIEETREVPFRESVVERRFIYPVLRENERV